ncbi:MAG TPA: hypothetical protein VGF45_12000, partial [Polyangia bacterium]
MLRGKRALVALSDLIAVRFRGTIDDLKAHFAAVADAWAHALVHLGIVDLTTFADNDGPTCEPSCVRVHL